MHIYIGRTALPGIILELRSLLSQFELTRFVHFCVQSTDFSPEYIQEITMEIVAKMLVKESEFSGSFANVDALIGYLKVAVLRRAIQKQQRDNVQRDLRQELAEIPGLSTYRTPEEWLVATTTYVSLQELLQEIMDQWSGAGQIEKDLKELLVLLLEDESLIRLRQSGARKGEFSFDIARLARTLGWSRQKVYDRLNSLQSKLQRECKIQGIHNE